jgi:hypothetical protein
MIMPEYLAPATGAANTGVTAPSTAMTGTTAATPRRAHNARPDPHELGHPFPSHASLESNRDNGQGSPEDRLATPPLDPHRPTLASREAEAGRPAYLPSRAASRASSCLHSRRGRHRGSAARRTATALGSSSRHPPAASPRARRHRQHRAQRALQAMNLAADRGLNTVGNRLEWRWGS